MGDLIENGYAISYEDMRHSDLEAIRESLENVSDESGIVYQPGDEREDMLLDLVDIEDGELTRYERGPDVSYLFEAEDAVMIYGDDDLIRDAIPGIDHWEALDDALSEDFDPDPI